MGQRLTWEAVFHNSMMPKFTALMAATVLVLTFNFRITFLTWKLTVFSEIPNIIPISHDDFPLATHRIHSFSLGERLDVFSIPAESVKLATFSGYARKKFQCLICLPISRSRGRAKLLSSRSIEHGCLTLIRTSPPPRKRAARCQSCFRHCKLDNERCLTAFGSC